MKRFPLPAVVLKAQLITSWSQARSWTESSSNWVKSQWIHRLAEAGTLRGSCHETACASECLNWPRPLRQHRSRDKLSMSERGGLQQRAGVPSPHLQPLRTVSISSSRPVQMNLFATWEIDSSSPSCVPRYAASWFNSRHALFFCRADNRATLYQSK